MATPKSAAEAAPFYDDMWTRYAHLDAASPAAFHRRRVVSELAAEVSGGARLVLDAGCGQGELLEALGQRLPRAEVEGADVSPRSIADSRAKSPKTSLFLLDLASVDFDEEQRERLGRYDLVVCSEVLEHIEDDALAARRLHSLVAEGGTLIATVPGGRMSRFDIAIGHHRHYRLEDLGRLVEGAGFVTERLLAWGFPFHNLYRTAVRIASRAASSEGAGGSGGAVPTALGHAYALFGRVLRPLFYANLDRWGEQMIVVAKKPREARR